MAITYAWRLDSNKFAYLLSPQQTVVTETPPRYKVFFDIPYLRRKNEEVSCGADGKINTEAGHTSDKGRIDYENTLNDPELHELPTAPDGGGIEYKMFSFTVREFNNLSGDYDIIPNENLYMHIRCDYTPNTALYTADGEIKPYSELTTTQPFNFSTGEGWYRYARRQTYRWRNVLKISVGVLVNNEVIGTSCLEVYSGAKDETTGDFIENPDELTLDGDWNTGGYGYVTTTPLTHNDLLMVARKSEQLFGKDGTFGFSGYTAAFNNMLSKVNLMWPDLQYMDFLSADVYYNVDASECADLRGVGIKGIRYLGAATQVDEITGKPISWLDIPLTIPDTTTNTMVANPSLGGKFSVYGIYMEDQYDSNGDLIDSPSPENMFLVYNGFNGSINGDSEDITDTINNAIEAKLTPIKNRLDTIENRIEELETIIQQLAGISIDSEGLGTMLTDVRTLKELMYGINEGDSITTPASGTVYDRLLSAEGRISANEAAIVNINNQLDPDDGPSDEPVVTGGNVTIEDYTSGIGSVKILGITSGDISEESYTLYRLSGFTYDDGNITAPVQITAEGNITASGNITANEFYEDGE